MQSLTPLATLLIILLWAPVSAAESGVSNSQSEASTAAVESAYGSPASEDSSLAGMNPTREGVSDTLQALSPIPVIALGILGLFWIRRHTAEL